MRTNSLLAEDPIALLARETRSASGKVDSMLDGVAVPEGSWHITRDAFLLRVEDGPAYLYRRGEGVTVDAAPDADPRDVSLWLNGTVYAAIASIAGLLPLHASAVAHEGRVYAFTGPSGAGKSTLIAALGRLGLPMFCDDTLVLDLSNPECITCLPGHKRLKLTPEAVALTGAEAQDRVATDVDKYFVRPPAGDVGECLPLAELVFLDEGVEPAIVPLSGTESFVRLQDDHYTSQLFARAHQFDRAAMFAHLARLARIRTARFVRPRDAARFYEGVALAGRYVTTRAHASGLQAT